MTLRTVSGFGLLSLACLMLSVPRCARADAEAYSSLTFGNLTITPSSGTVVYDGSWTAESFAQAQNSLGELNQQYASSNGATATADATATFATGHGDATALTLAGTASSSAIIPGSDPQQAISAGQSDLFNTFTITGGSGPVDVVFSADLLGSLHVMTDSFGQEADSETVFNLTLDGNSILFSDHLLSIGPNSDQTLPVSESLTNTVTLEFGTPYFVYVQPDSESMVITVPEPSAFALVLAGCAVLAGASRKIRQAKRMVNSLSKRLWLSVLPLLLLFLPSSTQAKYIGADPPQRCQTCGDPAPAPMAVGNGVVSGTEGNLQEQYTGPSVGSASGPMLSLSGVYNSRDADGSRAQVDTVMGYGWTHSYNIFLFSQVGNMFRYDGDGRVTKYTRKPGKTYAADTGYFETMVKNPDGTFTITNKLQTTFTFASIPSTPFLVGGPVWRLTKIIDRNDNTNTLAYTAGNLTSVSDTYGRSLTFAYNSSNKLVSATDPLGRTTTFAYDSTGRQLTKIIDPEGKTNQYSYNSMYQMTQKVDRDGRLTRYLYASGKPTLMMDSALHKWFGMSNPTNWAVNSTMLAQSQLRAYLPSTTTKSDGRNNVWSYTYNSLGYITNAVAPDGATTRYTYDPVTRQVASVTDANGNVTTYRYDSQGNRTNTTDALGHVTSYTYEPAFNHVTSMTDPKGRVTTYEYDSRGNLIRQIDPLTQTNSWTYDSHGNTITETDRRGNTVTYTYDSQGNRTNVTDALGNVTIYTYDAVGNQISRTDANGHVTTYQYDGLNRLTKKTDPAGDYDQFGYDGMGNRASATDRNGHTTTYQYDLRQRLTKTTDPLGNFETYTYDGNNNRTSTTDKNGHTTLYEYDVQNRSTKITDAEGDVMTRSYDGTGNVRTQVDANVHAAVYQYDALNRRVTTTDAEGNVTRYDYDTGGSGGCPTCGATPGSSRITALTDANGNITYYKYDELDRLTKVIRKEGDTNDVIDASDAVTIYAYDPVGNRLSLTEPNGNTTTYQYDSLNRQTQTVNAAGDVTQSAYDGVGNVVTNVLPNGNVTTYQYDTRDRQVRTTDSIGVVATNAYDGVGNRITQTDGNGNTTTYVYDALDRRTNTVDALGNVTQTQYDPVGNLCTNIDREGRTTTYSYDAVNRRTNAVDALVNGTQYQYDPVGNRTQITDANGNITQYQYDNINRLTRETYADTKTRTYTYDGVGNVTNRTDQMGRTTTYVYDDLYRLTQRTYPGGTNDSFGYDLSGRMTNATRAAWVVTYTYDGANRLTNTTQNGQTIISRCDIPGRAVTNTYPGGRTIIQSTDYRGRTTQIDGASPPSIVQYSYDMGNRVLARDYGNSSTTTYAYDSLDRIVSIEHSNTTTRIAGFRYAYDNEGNKLYEEKRHSPSDSECYGYDPIHRLIDFEVGTLSGSCVTGIVTQTQYDLDPVGNWLTNTVNAVPEIRAHNVVNELTLINATSLTYDDNGNLIDDGVYTYTYDEENRLTQVTRIADSAVVGQYQYDAVGRRVQKVANPAGSPTTTRYFYDDARIIEEQNGLGTTRATYVYGNYIDEVLTMDRGGQTYYYHQQALWSPAAITDSTGTPVERYTYDAYGCPVVTDGTGTPVPTNAWGTAHSAITNACLFTGRQLDEETGLYFYRARYYDCAQGRFIERDPIGYASGLNLYEYVRSRPTFLTDPFGNQGTDPSSSCCVLRERASGNPVGPKKVGWWQGAYVRTGQPCLNDTYNRILDDMEPKVVAECTSKYACYGQCRVQMNVAGHPHDFGPGNCIHEVTSGGEGLGRNQGRGMRDGIGTEFQEQPSSRYPGYKICWLKLIMQCSCGCWSGRNEPRVIRVARGDPQLGPYDSDLGAGELSTIDSVIGGGSGLRPPSTSSSPSTYP